MKSSRILLVASLPFIAISTILMAVAFRAYDPSVSNYFPNGSALPVWSVISVCVALAVGVAATVLSQREQNPFRFPSTPSYGLLPAALGSFISAILFLSVGKTLIGTLFLSEAVFCGLLVCPFVKRYAAYFTWLGFAAIAAQISVIGTYYFDMTVEMNAPVKVLLQMGMLAAMLDCTLEIRLLIGRPHKLMTPILTVFTVAVCGLSSIPLLFAFLGGKSPNAVYTAAIPVLLGYTITAALRFASLFQATVEPIATPENSNENSEMLTHESKDGRDSE